MDRNDRAIASFTGIGHGTFHLFELSIPVFVPAWLAAFDASATTLGIVVGAGYALVGLLAPVAGVLADRLGSKRLVVLSSGGMGLAFAGLSVVDSIVGLGTVLALWGAAASLYHPAGLSLISRGADRRARVLAYHGAGGNLGMVAGPLAAVLALVALDWRTVTLLLAVPAAVCLLSGLVLRFDETGAGVDAESPSGPGRGGGTAPSPRGFLASSRGLFVGGFVLVFAIQMLYGTYYRGVFTFLPDVLGGLPIFDPVAIGDREVAAGKLAYAGLLLVGVGGQYAGGVVGDRVTPERALVAICSSLAVASALFVPASNAGVVPLLAVCAVLGFATYAFAPVGQTLVAEYVPEGRHGLSFGYVYLGTFGVGALGAAVAGTTLDVGGVPALFGVLAGIVAVCGLVSAALLRRG